jgi:hypothetical protein
MRFLLKQRVQAVHRCLFSARHSHPHLLDDYPQLINLLQHAMQPHNPA